MVLREEDEDETFCLYIFVETVGDVEYAAMALLLLPLPVEDWIKFLLWARRPALASRFMDIFLSAVDVTGFVENGSDGSKYSVDGKKGSSWVENDCSSLVECGRQDER